jgi:hypothetical protein
MERCDPIIVTSDSTTKFRLVELRLPLGMLAQFVGLLLQGLGARIYFSSEASGDGEQKEQNSGSRSKGAGLCDIPRLR